MTIEAQQHHIMAARSVNHSASSAQYTCWRLTSRPKHHHTARTLASCPSAVFAIQNEKLWKAPSPAMALQMHGEGPPVAGRDHLHAHGSISTDGAPVHQQPRNKAYTRLHIKSYLHPKRQKTIVHAESARKNAPCSAGSGQLRRRQRSSCACARCRTGRCPSPGPRSYA